MIILDTNVISEPLRPQPSPAVTAWLDAQDPQSLYLTAVTVAELLDGCAALPDGHRRSALTAGITRRLLPLFDGRIIPFDQDATSHYGEIRARARLAGAAVGELDAMIAAIARSRGATVATRDVAPYVVAGVEVINPFHIGAGETG